MELRQGVQFTKIITIETEICCNCGIAFGIPSDFRSQLMNDPDHWFYCPNGHRQHYAESKEARLRREAERQLQQKQNQLLEEQTRRERAELELLKATRKLKRVSKGVCPCCNRTFEDLQRHMKSKHPETIKK